MENIMQMVKEAASYIKSRIDFKPEIAVILGSGLGPLAGKVNNQIIIKYSEIPHFKTSTVAGHAGELIAAFLPCWESGISLLQTLREESRILFVPAVSC